MSVKSGENDESVIKSYVIHVLVVYTNIHTTPRDPITFLKYDLSNKVNMLVKTELQ